MARQILLFGPQALAFDAKSFDKLRHEIHDNPEHEWILETVSSLPDLWEELVKHNPQLKSWDGKKMLQALSKGLNEGSLPDSLFPLPNILLTPLVVVLQLTQYFSWLSSKFPALCVADDLPASFTDHVEVLGLCTGILSAFAVACASSISKLKHQGTVAIRLAMLIGTLVTAEEILSDPEEKAITFSASWKNSQLSLNDVIKNFPEAQISVSVDPQRATVTVSKRKAPVFIEQLKAAGIRVHEVPLAGWFHSPKHEEILNGLVDFCNHNPQLQLPHGSEAVLKSWNGCLSSGSLHETALCEILLKQSDWVDMFNNVLTQPETAPEDAIICFGSERCIPPSVARKLGSQVVYVHDVNSSTASSRSENLDALPDERIAVIGMSCHVPGAEDLEEFWRLLMAGKSQHTEVPEERFPMETPFRERDPNRKWYGNFIKNYDSFDHKFFKKSPREMASMDPQQRLIMKLAYQAVEQSGYFSATDINKHIGCYIGAGSVDYEGNIACYPANAYSATGNLRSFMAGKISHYFGWTGPSLTIDTACSSSFVAIHHACRAIINGECATALAGGVNVLTGPDWFYNLAGASFLSPTGQCKPFDAKADGYCRGEGAGVVLLKRLSSALADGDQVLGVIASTRVYQNQNCTAITVPNTLSLSDLFSDTVRQARLKPEAVAVIEAHGTGTPVGDPAEYGAVRKVFGGPIRSDTLALTSLKGLVGHAECASGVMSLVKLLLMINEGFIPPQASFMTLNPALMATPDDKIEIPTQLRPWNAAFRASLINNYGASGSNASMVVTQPPNATRQDHAEVQPDSTPFPFWFCGADERSIRAYVTRFKVFLDNLQGSKKDLSAANLSFQLSRQSNRSLPYALVLIADSSNDLYQKLASFERGETGVASLIQNSSTHRAVILCFGGQISTYIGLDKDAYERNKVFRSHLDQCDTVCLSLGLGSIYPDIFQRSPLQDIVKLQTALFAIQYSSAKTWISCGLNVTAIVGHSFGELTGLCVAGVYSLETALKLISGRARLIKDRWGPDKGAMLAVEASLTDVNKLVSAIGQNLSIACYNGPRTFTLAGPSEAVQAAEELAKSSPDFSGIKAKRLKVTNSFHCALVDPLLDGLRSLGQHIRINQPFIEVERATESKSTRKLHSSFVAEHMRNPVFFDHAVQRLAQKYPDAVWLEAGSNSTITNMASRALGHPKTAHFQPVNITSDKSFPSLVNTTMSLWKAGLQVSFWTHHAQQVSDYTPLLLPPYQFDNLKHWMELKSPPKLDVQPSEPVRALEKPKGLTTLVESHGDKNSFARFLVNVDTEKFQRLASASCVANMAAVIPNTLQLSVVLDAFTKVGPELRNNDYQPEFLGVLYHQIFLLNPTVSTFLEMTSTDDSGLVWSWKIHNSASATGINTVLTTGTVIFRLSKDPEFQSSYDTLLRLSGRRRCLDLLEGKDVEDILQGRNLYRALEQVINYKEPLRCTTKIVGGTHESAGRVSAIYDKDTRWLDPAITECYCQTSGVFVNLMTDSAELPERGIYVCEKIDRWVRRPGLDFSSSSAQTWDVFAVHQQVADGKYISDVFVFNSGDGFLVEAIIGLSYQRNTLENIRKSLSGSQLRQPAPRSVEIATTIPTEAKLPKTTQAPEIVAIHQEATNTKSTIESSEESGPNVSEMTREIICNLSGLDSDEIKDDADLAALGIDSLMAMEVVREVEAAFKVTLTDEQLMELTDFKSLVVCIRLTLGLSDTSGLKESIGKRPVNGVPNGDTNGVSQVNGTHKHHNQDGELHDHSGNNETNGVSGAASTIRDIPLPDRDLTLDRSTVVDVFQDIKWSTDKFIVDGKLENYYNNVMPRATELAVAHIVTAFEQLGCSLRSAKPGDQLERIQHLPKHQQYVDWIYHVLKHDARLVDTNGSKITRTAVAPPSKSAEVLLNELLRDEPAHAAEHKLMFLTGSKLGDCLIGKEDGLRLIFGTPEGRELATDMYANGPCTSVWIQQLCSFLKKLVGSIANFDGTLRILEVGAGTGGTTCRILPLLSQLGIPVKYTVTDISSSLVAASRKRFKQYPFVEFKALDIEAEPDTALLQSQHIILATNCVHATRDLTISLNNCRRMLRSDGFLLLLEMTSDEVAWAGFIFGLLEGWWLFQDSRSYVLAPVEHWESVFNSVGYGHVDWTGGNLPEADIQKLIIAHASGPKFDNLPNPTAPSVSVSPTLPDTTKRWEVVEAYIAKYSQNFQPPSKTSSSTVKPMPTGKCVLVTGATGSLGSHIVANLTQFPDVSTIVCLNRISATEAMTRQTKCFETRGISLSPSSLSKLKVIGTDTSKPALGLSPELYAYVVQNVTHIVHSAWPMSLTRPVRGYEVQFKVFRNLIDLARDIKGGRPGLFKVAFQFISSIAVVGNYPLWKGEPLVPETMTTIESVPATGYADAKLACEHILDKTLRQYPDSFRAMAVRIAQISGSSISGYWNPTEYIPFLVKSSQVLRLLPDLDGTLSWYPVDHVATTLGELLMSAETSDMIYHIDNPSRQTWKDMIATLARALELPSESIVPFEQWINRVRRFRSSQSDNPALQLIEFFEHYFIPMSCGGLILDTTKASLYSKTLREMSPVSDEIMMKSVSSWKQSGFLYA